MGSRKISFVGLSAHGYMDAGLRFLFGRKPMGVEMVVANHANEKFKSSSNRFHPASLCGKLSKKLQDLAPDLKFTRSMREDDGIFRDDADSQYKLDMTPRYNFREFIETEIDDD